MRKAYFYKCEKYIMCDIKEFADLKEVDTYLSKLSKTVPMYDILGSVNLDSDNTVRESVLLFNHILKVDFICDIGLYCSENSNEITIGLNHQRFIQSCNIVPDEEFIDLMKRFFWKLGYALNKNYVSNIVYTAVKASRPDIKMEDYICSNCKHFPVPKLCDVTRRFGTCEHKGKVMFNQMGCELFEYPGKPCVE